MIKASCPENGIVLDPFAGTGTTAVACLLNKRHYITYELNPEYYEMIVKRIERHSSFFLQPPTLAKVNGEARKETSNQQSLF